MKTRQEIGTQKGEMVEMIKDSCLVGLTFAASLKMTDLGNWSECTVHLSSFSAKILKSRELKDMI